MDSSLLGQHSGVSLRKFYMIWDTKTFQADQDVWLRPATTKDGFDYYEYILVYVDDLLHASHNPDESMQQIMSR